MSTSGTTSRLRRATRRPGACTSAFAQHRASSSMRSGARASKRATATTALPGRGRSTRRTTTAPSCSIPTATASEAVHYDGMRRDGTIDHLWIRVCRPWRREAFLRDDRAARGLLAARRPAEPGQLRDGKRLVRRRRRRPADGERPPRISGSNRCRRRRIPPRRSRGGLSGQRPSGRAPGVPPRLLRGLRPRSRRQQRRGREPPSSTRRGVDRTTHFPKYSDFP